MNSFHFRESGGGVQISSPLNTSYLRFCAYTSARSIGFCVIFGFVLVLVRLYYRLFQKQIFHFREGRMSGFPCPLNVLYAWLWLARVRGSRRNARAIYFHSLTYLGHQETYSPRRRKKWPIFFCATTNARSTAHAFEINEASSLRTLGFNWKLMIET